MNSNFNHDDTFAIAPILTNAMDLYKQHFRPLISLGLLFGLSQLIPGVLFGQKNSTFGSLSFMLSMLGSNWVSMGLVYASIKVYKGKSFDLKDVMVKSFDKYWLYLAVNLTFMMVFLMGILLFVIPGIYVGTIFLLADVLVILERRQFMAAFQRSARLVKSQFVKVLQFSLLITCIFLIPTMVLRSFLQTNPQLGQTLYMVCIIFIMPYIVLTQVGLYYQLFALEKNIGQNS